MLRPLTFESAREVRPGRWRVVYRDTRQQPRVAEVLLKAEARRDKQARIDALAKAVTFGMAAIRAGFEIEPRKEER